MRSLITIPSESSSYDICSSSQCRLGQCGWGVWGPSRPTPLWKVPVSNGPPLALVVMVVVVRGGCGDGVISYHLACAAYDILIEYLLYNCEPQYEMTLGPKF